MFAVTVDSASASTASAPPALVLDSVLIREFRLSAVSATLAISVSSLFVSFSFASVRFAKELST